MKGEKLKRAVVNLVIASTVLGSPISVFRAYKDKSFKPTTSAVYAQSPAYDLEKFYRTARGEYVLSPSEAYNAIDLLSKRQIISSVDGLGAAVDSLKANDAAVIEYHDKRVFDYKVGSLSGGKDVYVGVEARNISRGGYSLLVYLYLVDRNTGDTLSLGGLGLSRWGMPHTLRNSPIERRYAYLWEDVQSFIKALRVYEFKDRWVAVFVADHPTPSGTKRTHMYRFFVIPKAKEGEEGWFEPYMIVWDVPGMKEELADVYFVSALSEGGKRFNYMLVAEIGERKDKGYFNLGFIDHAIREASYAVGTVKLDNWEPPKDLRVVSLGSNY